MGATPGPGRERHRFVAGHVLFREGERSRIVYRLAEGGVEVTRRAASGAEVVGHVGPGEYLGEIGVLVATRRSGTARFTADSEVEVFSRDEFLQRAAGDATIGRPLINVLSLRNRANIARLEQQGQDLPATRRRWRRAFPARGASRVVEATAAGWPRQDAACPSGRAQPYSRARRDPVRTRGPAEPRLVDRVGPPARRASQGRCRRAHHRTRLERRVRG